MKHWRFTAVVLVLALLLGMLPAALAEQPSTDTFCSATTSGNHSWGEWKTNSAPTCTRDGSRSRTCGRCGYTQTETLKKTGHKWSGWTTTKKATCAKAGEETRKCSVCGQKETRQTDKKAHTWGAWTVTVEPTDFTAGTKVHTCKVCGKERSEEFYPDGTLRRGDKGESVKALQEQLNAAGYDCGKADGDFGKKTEAAVKALEEAHGFTADGIAWPGVQDWLAPKAAVPGEGGPALYNLSLRNNDSGPSIVSPSFTLTCDMIPVMLYEAGDKVTATCHLTSLSDEQLVIDHINFGEDDEDDVEDRVIFWDGWSEEGPNYLAPRATVDFEVEITLTEEDTDICGERFLFACAYVEGREEETWKKETCDIEIYSRREGIAILAEMVFTDRFYFPGDELFMPVRIYNTGSVDVALSVEGISNGDAWLDNAELIFPEGVAERFEVGGTCEATLHTFVDEVDTAISQTDGWPGVAMRFVSLVAADVNDPASTSKTTAEFYIFMTTPLEIVTQPVGGEISHADGETLTLTVEAAGGEPLALTVETADGEEVYDYAYQWYRFVSFDADGNRPLGEKTGVNAPEYPADRAGRYFCKVTDGVGQEAYSDVVEVTSELYIVRQPQNTNLSGQESVTLRCVAEGGEPFPNGTYIYAWYDGNDEQIAFSDVGAAVVSAEGEYYCVVQDHGNGLVTSEKCQVYDAAPIFITIRPEKIIMDGETATLSAWALGGVLPYTAHWYYGDVDLGEAEPILDELQGPDEYRFDAESVGYGVYTIKVYDAMEQEAEEHTLVSYGGLLIEEQPVGGMLPSDGSSFALSVKMNALAEQSTLYYDLYRNGDRYESQTNDNTFHVTEAGEYFIVIWDEAGHNVASDDVIVQDYEFYIESLSASDTLSGPESAVTLTAEVVGGTGTISYRWICEQNYGIELPDTAEPSCEVWLPGTYTCEAMDAGGNTAKSQPVEVLFTGEKPLITIQPVDVTLSYSPDGGYSAELTCLAASGSPHSPYHTPIMYTWEYKEGDTWLYNREQGPTIPVTRPGTYHCICRDTYSGQATISREVTVSLPQ